MKISVTQLAWSDPENALDVLRINDITMIDIVPGKYKDGKEALDFWSQHGIEIIGAQSLLYGCSDNMFGSNNEREAIAERLEHVFKLCSAAGATRLTFGSPKNRDKKDISEIQSKLIAVAFFQRLGDIAKQYGVTLCLEPNPAIYGCNFMTTTAEAAEIVLAVDHPNIKLQLDLGCVTQNQENIHEILEQWSNIIGHVHISEPYLAALENNKETHAVYAKALNSYFPDKIATIEVVNRSEDLHLELIESIAIAKTYYV